METDDLRWKLIEAGHNAIFQWVAVYVASGIGLIQMIIEILKIHNLVSFSLIVFGTIYFVLIGLMTLSVYSILGIMHKQNGWAGKLEDTDDIRRDKLKKLYFESRSWLSKEIVGERATFSVCEEIGVVLHFLGLLFFGLGIVLVNFLFPWFLLYLH